MQRKKIGRIYVSQNFLDFFRFWAERLRVLSKNYKQGRWNCNLCVQENTFRAAFLKQDVKYCNIFGLLVKFPWKRRKIFSGLNKAHFACPEQHFQKKMLKVYFAACGFFKTLCRFFTVTKNLHCVSKPQIRRTEKNFRENFSVTEVFSNKLRFWAEEFWDLAKKYWQIGQNYIL